MNYTPAENPTLFGPDGKGQKLSIRGSIDSRNLIPIAEVTKSPKSYHQKANAGSNLSTANIKGQLIRGGGKQRRLLTAHPTRARNMRNASAMLAPNHPNSYSRIKHLHGAASAAHYNAHTTLVSTPAESGSQFPVSMQTVKDAEFLRLRSYNSVLKKQSLRQQNYRRA